MLVASFIKACQGDVNDFCLSCSTTYRAHIANRLQISDEIFQEIREAPSQDLALLWDDKLTKDCFDCKLEALSVLVSGTSTYKVGKLLRVQRLEKASGKAQANASYDLLEVWNLKQHVKALVFDTTASNTGWNNGAAKCLEKLLDQKLFTTHIVVIYMSLLSVLYIQACSMTHQLQMMSISNVFEQSGQK